MPRSRPPRTGPAAPQPVGEVLSALLERRGLAPKLEAVAVLHEWPERVGERIAQVAQPVRLNEGTLFVAVANSAWLMELNLMKADLLRRINAGKGKGRIRQLVLVMAGDDVPASPARESAFRPRAPAPRTNDPPGAGY